MKNAIEKIHAAARECPIGGLDENIFLDSDICFFLLGRQKASFKGFCDVPLSAVACMVRNDWYKEKAKTWREATFCLHGDGWGEKVFEYFEGDFLEKSFPAPSCLYHLKLQSVGGLVSCANGTHRLVAAKAWLLHTQGESAVLKQASLERFEIDPLIEKLLYMAVNNNEEIAISFVEPDEREYLRIDNQFLRFYLRIGKDKFFVRTEENIYPLANKFHFSDISASMRSGMKCYGRKNWKVVPTSIVCKALNKSW
ncbi:hypothetical protein [Sapientia aquatica]|uniref:Uncharacterized protein n=1 Tax=Sapientia aquatica TaxID=1549640 RepID=A0A4R5VR98_9BURK|nr:hypothetical protein [Sapientia aquatica]TDK61194.1 hypothetical protein E2I14_17535 [Sapientia aquatica]